MQNTLKTASGDNLHHLGIASTAPSDRLRVLLIDENQLLLDSIHHWLSLTNTVNIVGKVVSAVSALSMWESLKPDVIILGVPYTTEASAASANYVQAIKALDTDVRVILLAWDLPAMNRESLTKFMALVDAWMLKQTVCEDLLPVLAMLFPNRVRLHDRLAHRTTFLATEEGLPPL